MRFQAVHTVCSTVKIAPLEGSSDYPATINCIRSAQEVRVKDFVRMFTPAEKAAGDIEQQACTLLDTQRASVLACPGI